MPDKGVVVGIAWVGNNFQKPILDEFVNVATGLLITEADVFGYSIDGGEYTAIFPTESV